MTAFLKEYFKGFWCALFHHKYFVTVDYYPKADVTIRRCRKCDWYV
jgi:hypothetical protein